MSLIHKYARMHNELRLVAENARQGHVASAKSQNKQHRMTLDLRMAPSVLHGLIEKEADALWKREGWDKRVLAEMIGEDESDIDLTRIHVAFHETQIIKAQDAAFALQQEAARIHAESSEFDPEKTLPEGIKVPDFKLEGID